MKKGFKVFAAVLVSLTVICLFAVASIYLTLIMVHHEIIEYVPDTSDWSLTTDKYDVVPIISEHSVRFYVHDKSGKVVYTSPHSWRTWDFKSIDIDPSTYDIKAISGDTGEDYYFYNGETWKEAYDEGFAVVSSQ